MRGKVGTNRNSPLAETRAIPPQDLQWAELIYMTKLAQMSKCAGRPKSVTLRRTSSREEEVTADNEGQAAPPPPPPTHPHLRLCPPFILRCEGGSRCQGLGGERSHVLGWLPKDLESGVEEAVSCCSSFPRLVQRRFPLLFLNASTL